MKILQFQTLKSAIRTSALIFAVALIASQSSISGLSAQAQTAVLDLETQATVTRIQTELDRRKAQTDKALEAVQSSNAVSAEAKAAVLKSVNESKTSIDALSKQVASVKDLKSAKELAASVDKQYDQFATANAKSATLKDSDSQTQIQQQLSSLAKDVQSKIDAKGASGGDVSGDQDQMKLIQQLIAAIAAISASVVALIIALAAGNYSEAATIFVAILGQLAQNLASILNVQGSLQVMIGSVGSFGATDG
jgi:DNA repair exonuclease SbcCD ATPase subunit